MNKHFFGGNTQLISNKADIARKNKTYFYDHQRFWHIPRRKTIFICIFSVRMVESAVMDCPVIA